MPPASCRPRKRWKNFSRTSSPDKRAKLIDHLLAARRVRRLLGLQMVRSAAGLEPAASNSTEPCGRSTTGFATASSRTSPGTSSRARSSPAPAARRDNGALNYFVLHKRSDRSARKRDASVPRPAHHLRALPQSSARKVDAETVLPDGESVRPRRDQEWRRARRHRGVRQSHRRHQSSAPARPAAAHAARWPSHSARFHRRPPHHLRRLADQPEESLLRAHRS